MFRRKPAACATKTRELGCGKYLQQCSKLTGQEKHWQNEKGLSVWSQGVRKSLPTGSSEIVIASCPTSVVGGKAGLTVGTWSWRVKGRSRSRGRRRLRHGSLPLPSARAAAFWRCHWRPAVATRGGYGTCDRCDRSGARGRVRARRRLRACSAIVGAMWVRLWETVRRCGAASGAGGTSRPHAGSCGAVFVRLGTVPAAPAAIGAPPSPVNGPRGAPSASSAGCLRLH